jgi:Uncharacterized protein conserved in bacteria (DUF2059).
MRHLPAALALTLCLFAAAPALATAAKPAPAPSAPAPQEDEVLPPNAPKTAEVLEYIKLFGYRSMLEASAERQLDSVIELMRQAHPDVAPGVLDLIHKEFQAEIQTATDRAVHDMVPVFQRYLTHEDVAYLLSVGRDPRMQKVVALQPKIAEDMEAVGDNLAEDITARAAPRIEERLQKLEGGQPL